MANVSVVQIGPQLSFAFRKPEPGLALPAAAVSASSEDFMRAHELDRASHIHILFVTTMWTHDIRPKVEIKILSILQLPTPTPLNLCIRQPHKQALERNRAPLSGVSVSAHATPNELSLVANDPGTMQVY